MKSPLSASLLALAFCAVVSGVEPGAATPLEGSFLQPPRLEGWTAERDESGKQLTQLSDVVLTSTDGRTTIRIFVRAFSPNPRPGRSGLGLVLTSATWLPRTTSWIPIAGQGECFRSRSLRRSPDPRFAVFGQARCRRENFVVGFDFASTEKASATATAWRGPFARLVSRTGTAATCLSSEEMTYLADYEGPPFVVRHPDARTVDVAAQSMCGTGGCAFWRYRKARRCHVLVGIVGGFAD